MTAALRHTYSPRGTSQEIQSARGDEVVVAGPAGTGKSRACLEKLMMLCLFNPGLSALIVRKTAISLTNTAMATWEKWVAKEIIAAGICQWYGGSAKEPAAYKFRNGSSVQVAGMDKPTKVMSSEYDIIYVQEATELSETDWEMLSTRLRSGVLSYQQLLADCNPDAPTHWLKQRAQRDGLMMVDSRHEENPVYFHEDGTMTERGKAYMEKLDALTGVRYHRLRKGLWVGAEGIIYDEFDPAVHVVDEMPAGWERWPRIWSVDFGYVHPFVCQRWAEDPDGALWLYAETYRSKRLVEDHARDILEESKHEPRPQYILADHDAEDRATFERHVKMPTRAAHKTVSDGIQATAVRFRKLENGRPRIYFKRRAVRQRDNLLAEAKQPTCTLEELPGYVWQDNGKEAPLKERDDGMDAMRYVVAEKDLKGGYRMRVVSI